MSLVKAYLSPLVISAVGNVSTIPLTGAIAVLPVSELPPRGITANVPFSVST